MASALSPVFLPRMISTSIILSTGEKKWMPMKFFGRAEFLARPVIGMVEVLEAKIADDFSTASACLGRRLLDGANPRTPPRRRGRSRRDRHSRRVGVISDSSLSLLLRLGAALLDLIRDQAVGMRLALFGGRHVAVEQHDRNAGLGRDIGDAGAHEAGAEHADLLELGFAARRPGGGRPCSVPAATRTASGSSSPLRSSA